MTDTTPQAGTNLQRDEAAHRSATITVDRYDVTVDVRAAIDDGATRFGVHSVVTFDSADESTWLDFRDAEVSKVVVNGVEVPVRYVDSRVQLDGLVTDRPNVVEVEGLATYSRSGQGLHRFVDPVDGEVYLYTQYEPADSRRVFPNFEQPDLKAVFHFSVKAPEGWTVLCNQPEVASEALADGGVRHDFAPTPRLSTYLTAICAGRYHHADGGLWTAPDGTEVALGLWCRESLSQHMDSDAILQITREGLDFYEEHFGLTYPWGKYDQVFVPEYNLGAMENPGCVTFTESYLFRSAATRSQYQGRANTILHEMAHMWFGDLVTPAWWDDLWLKESFAEFMGSHVSTQATQYTDAWVAFAGRRKSWAYAQDQLPTTHPIVADITDLEAAAQNFDGITYAKGAAVLKQLVAHVGLDNFMAGSRAYFQTHAFSSARLADLLAALEEVSGRNLSEWSGAWLQTAGPDSLVPEVEVAEGRIVRLAVHQHSTDARTGERVGRPHTLRIGLYALEEDTLVRRELLDVELDGSEVTEVPAAVGLAAPALVLVNDEDLTYAKIGLDETSLLTVLDHLSGLTDPLARALVWSSLWNMTRDAELQVVDYLKAVLAHGPAEDDSATLGALHANVWLALCDYVDDDVRAELRPIWRDGLRAGLAGAPVGSDQQLLWARALATAAIDDDALVADIRSWLEGAAPAGLEVGADLRWAVLFALGARGVLGEDEIEAELLRDPSAQGRVEALAARTARPDASVKADAWARVMTPRANSNDEVNALVAGLAVAGQRLVSQLNTGWFERLETIWSQHAQEIAQRIVRGLVPEQDAAITAAQTWLDAHPQAPGALRRCVIESMAAQIRAREARAFNSYAR